MKLKIWFLIIYSAALSGNFNELIYLSTTLQNLSQKNLTVISDSDLYATIAEVFKNENISSFDKFPHLKTLLKFMFEKLKRSNDGALIILSLIKTYEQILKTCQPNLELRIVSLAGCGLSNEAVLLEALINAGYNNITLYSIDPMSPETSSDFKKYNSELKNINYRHFKVAQEYIRTVIQKEKKIPHVCIAINPGTPFISRVDFNYFDRNDEQEILITPESLDEISMLISPQNQDYITEFNNKIQTSKDKDKLTLITFFDTTLHKSALRFKANVGFGPHMHHNQYGLYEFHQSLVVDFLELIKSASAHNKDCITCYCCWYKALNGNRVRGSLHLVHYKDIAIQSTALLFKKTLLYPNDWKTYIYNKVTNQFEIEKFSKFFSERNNSLLNS